LAYCGTSFVSYSDLYYLFEYWLQIIALVLIVPRLPAKMDETWRLVCMLVGGGMYFLPK